MNPSTAPPQGRRFSFARIPSLRRSSSSVGSNERRRSSFDRRRRLHMVEYRQSVATFDPFKLKNNRLRWNLLWTVLVIGIGLSPNWLNFAFGCSTGWAIMAFGVLFLDSAFYVAACFTWYSLFLEWKQYKSTQPELRHLPKTELDCNNRFVNTTTEVKDSAESDGDGLSMNGESPSVTHLVIMCGYNEPVELMCSTLDTVAAQTIAKKLTMVIGLEQRTQDYEKKVEFFENRYGNSFLRLIQTVHPYGLPGEIPGTCSNANWAVRQATTFMRDLGNPFDPKTTILTKLDTDTLFLPTHFEVLEREFLRLAPEERTGVMFQSVLTYNLALDKRWFFARITGILRTFFMLGFLIPFNINTMSIYSLSLELARKADYWLPHYQMEDIVQNLNLMIGAGKRVPIQLLPLPTVSGPTSGKNLWEEFEEWRLQARRWTIGAAEVFHYYVVKLIGHKFDVRSGFSYGFSFTLYYGFILCVTGLFQLTAIWGANLNGCKAELGAYHYGGGYPFPFVSPGNLYSGKLACKYFFIMGTAFSADAIHRRISGVKEPTLGFAGGPVGVVRSIFQFFMAVPVLLSYNLVEALAIIELSFRGREICGHVVSKKDALASTNGNNKEMEPATELTVKERHSLEFEALQEGRHRASVVSFECDVLEEAKHSAAVNVENEHDEFISVEDLKSVEDEMEWSAAEVAEDDELEVWA